MELREGNRPASEARAVPRREGWTALPLRCPKCGKRVRERAIVFYTGVLMCDRGCNLMLYVLPVRRLGIADVLEVTPVQAKELQLRELTALRALDFLGVRFPEEAA